MPATLTPFNYKNERMGEIVFPTLEDRRGFQEAVARIQAHLIARAKPRKKPKPGSPAKEPPKLRFRLNVHVWAVQRYEAEIKEVIGLESLSIDGDGTVNVVVLPGVTVRKPHPPSVPQAYA